MVVSVEPIHSSAQKSVDLEIDHLNLIAMQNNFAIKRVESVARRLKLLSNLDLRREDICHEKSHLFTDSYCSFSPNYQSFEKYEPSVSLDEKRKQIFLFTSGSEDQSHHTSHQQSTHQYTYHHNLPSISSSRSGVSSSQDSLLEKSFSPACRHSRNKILFCLLTTGFSLYALFSIIAPFYPQEANHKGIPTSIYGLVFSSHALTIMLICPLIGRLLHRFEIKNLLICGVFLTGLSMILFGCLHYLESSLYFGLFSFILRIVGAIGFAIFHTSANIYITKLYPKSIGTVFGLIETFCGLGLSFGPVIGGALYDWYGFPMPFWVFGSLTALNVLFYHYLIQPLSEVVPEFEEQLSDDPYSPKLTYWKLLQNIRVLVICLATVVISQNQSFLDPTVEPHLYRHGIKESQVALTFFLMNAAFALLSPVVGWFSLRIDKYILMSLGLLVSATGLLCLGPPFFLDAIPNLKNSSISMVIMGVAYSLTFVPSFEALLEHAVEKDRFENLATYSMVAALYTAIFSLGEATGPALGGVLSQYFGFQMSTLIMSAITLVAGFLMMLTRCI